MLGIYIHKQGNNINGDREHYDKMKFICNFSKYGANSTKFAKQKEC